MALNSRAVSVTTSATRLDTVDSANVSNQSASVYNAGSATVYLGPAGVTTATGYPLTAGEHFAVDLGEFEVLYGIVATGTAEVRVLEVRV